jgi:hypothetical protein
VYKWPVPLQFFSTREDLGLVSHTFFAHMWNYKNTRIYKGPAPLNWKGSWSGVPYLFHCGLPRKSADMSWVPLLQIRGKIGCQVALLYALCSCQNGLIGKSGPGLIVVWNGLLDPGPRGEIQVYKIWTFQLIQIIEKFPLNINIIIS